MGGRTGQTAGRVAALVSLVAAAVALAGPDTFEEVDTSAPGRIRRLPR